MKLFIWDFHGVLEKGNDFAVIEITNLILGEFGYKRRINEYEAQLLSGKKWFEYFEYLLPNINHDEHKKLQLACFQKAKENSQIAKKHLRANDNAINVLEKIFISDHDQILISNTQQNALIRFLEMINIKQYLLEENIFGIDAHINPNSEKKEVLLNFLKDKSYDETISIGDSKHDMELAHLHKKGISFLYSHPHMPFKTDVYHYKTNSLLDVIKMI